MKRKFITNLALVIALNLLVKPFWIFGIDREVQNAVGNTDYGFYFALFNFSLILNILLDLGITNYNNRNIAQHSQLLSKHLSNIVVLKFLLAVVYFIVSISVAMIIGYDKEQIRLLLFLLFNQFLLSFILYMRSNISGLHFFRTDSVVSVLDRFLMIVICGFLLYNEHTKDAFKIEWFVYAQTVGYTLTAIIAFVIVLAKSEFIKLNFDRKFFIVFLKQSYPYALLILLMSMYNRVDSVMLERLLGSKGDFHAGIYAQAFRILDAAAMFAFLFAGLLLPIFAKMLKQKEPVEQLVQLSFLLIIVPAITFSVCCAFYSKEIMDLLYENHSHISDDLLGILIFGFIAMSITYIFGTLLTANGNMKQLNKMAATGLLINVVLNLIFIPKYQAYGAAITSLVTQSFTAIAQVFIAKRILKLSINWKLIFTLLLFVIGVVGLGLITRHLLANWVLGFFLTAGLSAALAFGIRLISLKNLYEIVKYEK